MVQPARGFSLGRRPDWARCLGRTRAQTTRLGALRRFGGWALVASLALLLACGGEAPRPPSSRASSSASIEAPPIGLELDGRELPTLDPARLAAAPSEELGPGRRAWRLHELLGAPPLPAGTVITLRQAGGAESRLTLVAGKAGPPAPVLYLEGGALRFALSAAEAGEGGPRELRRIRVSRPGQATQPASAGAERPFLSLLVAGEPARSLGEAELSGLGVLRIQSERGEGEREAWSLRALAEGLYGPGAAVTEILDEEGRSLAIGEAAWSDRTKIPVLRKNRRGRLKFHWVTAALAPAAEAELQGVVGLRIRRAAPK